MNELAELGLTAIGAAVLAAMVFVAVYALAVLARWLFWTSGVWAVVALFAILHWDLSRWLLLPPFALALASFWAMDRQMKQRQAEEKAREEALDPWDKAALARKRERERKYAQEQKEAQEREEATAKAETWEKERKVWMIGLTVGLPLIAVIWLSLYILIVFFPAVFVQ